MDISILGIKVSIFFGLISAIISYICGYFVGNESWHIFKIGSIVFVANSIIAFVCFHILKLEIPEIISLVGNFSTIKNENTQYTTSASSNEQAESMPNKLKKAIKENKKENNDYITVENTKVKNEPELMAKAIKTMLSKDEE